MSAVSRSGRVLVIDDDEEIRALLSEVLGMQGYEITAYSRAEDALADRPSCDAVLCDLMLPDMDGLEFIERAADRLRDVPVILITAHATVETAIQALNRGAFDYVTKPLNLTEVSVLLGRAIQWKKLRSDYEHLQERLKRVSSMGDLIGKSPKMQAVFDLIERVSRSQANVLITGESGTGKERVARAIHTRSSRASKPFVAINCAAIPENLLESELFGHRRGAFTGANEERRGLFEEAHTGTIFLDEIGDMPMSLQAKLLRVLQERKVRPVGHNQSRDIDVRLIAATHQNLRKRIEEGRFREDLYYRLCVIPIELPALRERREDIPLLAEHFLAKFCQTHGMGKKSFSRSAIQKLLRLSWEGNVRELENTIERAVVLSERDVIDETDLMASGSSEFDEAIGGLFSKLPTLEELEKRYIDFVLAQTGDHKEKTAAILGINRKTLYRKERESEEST